MVVEELPITPCEPNQGETVVVVLQSGFLTMLVAGHNAKSLGVSVGVTLLADLMASTTGLDLGAIPVMLSNIWYSGTTGLDLAVVF